MILRQDELAKRLAAGAKRLGSPEGSAEEDPLVINPFPKFDDGKRESVAAVDLRLGTWFLSFKQDHSESLRISKGRDPQPSGLTKTHYVPFHRSYFLHPQSFVLAVTLEWIRLPRNLAGYVIGKSSWGRRGLIIATAVGVHPCFSGCLTLELSNVGEVPIEIRPGMSICQLFLHTATEPGGSAGSCAAEGPEGGASSAGTFSGFRMPRLGEIKMDEDEVATALQREMPLGLA